MPKQLPQPTGQYKAALYGLKCGDRSFAEYFARNQMTRSRSAREQTKILCELGWLSEAGKRALGLVSEQLTLTTETSHTNGDSNGSYNRLSFCLNRLREVGPNGLKIWSLVSEVGQEEGVANPRDRNWRSPVAAELDEYADRGLLVRVGDRLYTPEAAPEM